MAKKIKWTGPLARPIKWAGPLTPRISRTILGDIVGEPDDASQAKNEARYDAAMRVTFFESLTKLRLLKKQFGIPVNGGPWTWVALSLALAKHFDIPGFRIMHQGDSRGRKRALADGKCFWWDGRCIGLILDVEQVKADQGIKTDSKALLFLVSKPSIYCSNPSRNLEIQKKEARNLNARLTEARRRVREKKLEHILAQSNPWRCLFAPGTEYGKILRETTFGL